MPEAVLTINFTQQQLIAMGGLAAAVYVIVEIMKFIFSKWAPVVYANVMFQKLLPDLGGVFGAVGMYFINLWPEWYTNCSLGFFCGIFASYIFKTWKQKFTGINE